MILEQSNIQAYVIYILVIMTISNFNSYTILESEMIAQQKEQTQQQSMKTQAHTTVNNAVLARLMNEVRVEKSVGDRYDRAHNRHNR